MPALKVTLLASVCSKPYKLVRTIATTPSPKTTTFTIAKPNCTAAAWRISPCAPLCLLAYDKAQCRKLGFGGGSFFHSSGEKGGEIVPGATMGSDDKGDRFPTDDTPTSALKEHHRQSPVPAPSPEQHQHQSAKLLTLPTVLTIGRVAAVPLLVGTFYVDSWWGTTATTSIFIVAAITDWLDGYIARKMRLGSAFGAFLDPVADKLMVAATLILLCTRPFEVPMYGQVPWVLTVPAIAIIGREITMSAVREWAASQNGKLSEAVAVNNLGKWKTASQMTALIILLATRDSSLAVTGTLVASGVVLLYISAWLSVWSLVVYMRKIWKVLLK